MATIVNGERCMWVLDPLTRKLLVPMRYLVQTQATQTPGTVPSLCIAFLENRCHHAWCRQAHVLPNMIHKLRHDALHAPTCCVSHGDPHDLSCLTSRFSTVTIVDSCNAEPFPTSSVALTVGLQRHLAQSVPAKVDGGNLELSSRLICRLHLAQRCRYLEDCNNIHVCRRLDLRLHPPPHMVTPLTALVPEAESVCIGDTQYSVLFIYGPETSEDEFKKLLRHRRIKDMRKHRRIVDRIERQQLRRPPLPPLNSSSAIRSSSLSPASDAESNAAPEENWEIGSQESSMSSSPFSTSLSSLSSERSDDDVIYLYEKMQMDADLSGGRRAGDEDADLGDSFVVHGAESDEPPMSATNSPPQHATMFHPSPMIGSSVASMRSTPMFAPHPHPLLDDGTSPLHTFQPTPPLYACNEPGNSMSMDPNVSPGCSSAPDPYLLSSGAPLTSSGAHNVVPQSLPQPPYTRVYDVRQVSKEKGSPTPFAPQKSPTLSGTGSVLTNSPEQTGGGVAPTTRHHHHNQQQSSSSLTGGGTTSKPTQQGGSPSSTPPYAVAPTKQSDAADPSTSSSRPPPCYSPLSLPSAAEDLRLLDGDGDNGNPADSPMQLGEGMQSLKPLVSATTTKSTYAAAVLASGSNHHSIDGTRRTAVPSTSSSAAGYSLHRDPATRPLPRGYGMGSGSISSLPKATAPAVRPAKVATPAKPTKPYIPTSDEGVSTMPEGAGWKVLPLE